MKLTLTLLFLFINLLSIGQIISQEELKKMPKREISNAIPDTNFTTIQQDTVVKGEILALCKSLINTSGHGFTSQIGTLTIYNAEAALEIQVVFVDNTKVEHLKEGDTATLDLTRYRPDDKDFSATSITCAIIKKPILICKLK